MATLGKQAAGAARAVAGIFAGTSENAFERIRDSLSLENDTRPLPTLPDLTALPEYAAYLAADRHLEKCVGVRMAVEKRLKDIDSEQAKRKIAARNIDEIAAALAGGDWPSHNSQDSQRRDLCKQLRECQHFEEDAIIDANQKRVALASAFRAACIPAYRKMVIPYMRAHVALIREANNVERFNEAVLDVIRSTKADLSSGVPHVDQQPFVIRKTEAFDNNLIFRLLTRDVPDLGIALADVGL